MTPLGITNNLSTHQRNCLINHACGPQRFDAHDSADLKGLRATKQRLLDLKLLTTTGGFPNPRPAELKLSYLGSQIVCILLSRIIENLVQADVINALTDQKALSATTEASQRKRPKCTDPDIPYHAVATHLESHAQSTRRDRDATDKLAQRLSLAGS